MTALAMASGTDPHAGPAIVPPWPFVCPECLAELRPAHDGLRCAAHGAFRRRGGVWRLLTPERADRYARFVREYGAVRRAEGRGGESAAYYRALPYDRTGPLAAQWRIRARGFEALVRDVVEPLERGHGRPLDVLDLGAGNGWLSARLARRGHRVAAVDLFDDERDGLGAHHWYQGEDEPGFTSVQADFDRLPFADGAADLVIFDASLHYTTDLAATLAEAARVIRPGGRIVVLDSPVYRSAEPGRRMVAEREADFRARHGFPSDALPSAHWFTAERLAEAGAAAGLRWRVRVPWRGLRWALRPWVARLQGRREPSSFWLLIGEPSAAPDAPAPRRRSGALAGLRRAALYARHRVLGQGRRRRTVEETVLGLRLSVPPGVFNPRVFRTGELLARFVGRSGVADGALVLDLGTGSGVVALAAAAEARRVVAVDINPDAARCAADNARANGLADRVDVRAGDLFEPLAPGERFDLVAFNPPFYRGVPTSPADAAWRSADVPERFVRGLAERLTPGGRALVVLSSDCDVDGWLRPARAAGLVVREVARRDLGNEVLLLYRIAVPPSQGRRTGGGMAR